MKYAQLVANCDAIGSDCSSKKTQIHIRNRIRINSRRRPQKRRQRLTPVKAGNYCDATKVVDPIFAHFQLCTLTHVSVCVAFARVYVSHMYMHKGASRTSKTWLVGGWAKGSWGAVWHGVRETCGSNRLFLYSSFCSVWKLSVCSFSRNHHLLATYVVQLDTCFCTKLGFGLRKIINVKNVGSCLLFVFWCKM